MSDERNLGARYEPETFPGGGFYWPSVSSSASASTLTMTDEEKQGAAEREASRGTFGFGRALDSPELREDNRA